MQLRQMFNTIEQDLQKVDQFLINCLDSKNIYIQKAYKYLLEAGGKRIRPAFTLLTARYGSEENDKIVPLASAFELVHMASLLHDDVIDCSEVRRGEPTIRTLYGNNFSLHLGDFLFAKALDILNEYNNVGLNNLLAYACIEMCRGELEQIHSAYNYFQDIKNYFYRIKRKTSLLIALSCQGGASAAGADPQIVRILGQYGHNIGMAFQITDDVLDYIADEENLGKPVGSDIKQGIVTLPLIFLFKYGKPTAQKKLLKILKKREFLYNDVKEMAVIMENTDAVRYSLEIANRFVDKALNQLDLLPENETTGVLRQVGRFIYHRDC